MSSFDRAKVCCLNPEGHLIKRLEYDVILQILLVSHLSVFASGSGCKLLPLHHWCNSAGKRPAMTHRQSNFDVAADSEAVSDDAMACYLDNPTRDSTRT